MKKFVSLLTAAALTAGLTTLFVGCGGDDNRSYVGDISAEKYSSLDDAAVGCIDNEVAGITTGAKFKSYTKERTLGNRQIEELDLTDGERKELTSAEEGTITYSAALRGEELEESQMRVIILTFGSEYAYYLPEPEEGENMTASYYNRLMNEEFDNFTMSMNSTISSTVDEVTVKLNTQFDLKYTGTELWFKTSISEDTSATDSQTTEIFAAEEDGKLTIWMSLNGSDYLVVSSAEYVNLGELLEETMSDMATSVDIDHSFFVKTDFGFGVRSDRIESTAARMFAGLQLADVTSFGEMSYNFFINDGSITSTVVNCSVTFTDGDKTVTRAMMMHTQITDIGTTEIHLPELDK